MKWRGDSGQEPGSKGGAKSMGGGRKEGGYKVREVQGTRYGKREVQTPCQSPHNESPNPFQYIKLPGTLR